jgi:hypothetical protein
MTVASIDPTSANQRWAFLGIPSIAAPYGGFVFCLINLGDPNTLGAAYAPSDSAQNNTACKLIPLDEVTLDNQNALWQLQPGNCINCNISSATPLTIFGGSLKDWTPGQIVQLFQWREGTALTNQMWTIEPF